MTETTFADVDIDIPPGRSGEVDTTCPKCSPTRKKSRDKCLSVNTDEQTWFCHHCQWSGSLNGAANSQTSYGAPLRKTAYTAPQEPPPPDDGLTPAVLTWFERRGISEEVLRERGITAGTAFVPQLGNEATAIQFPYRRDGRLVNIKYRAHPKHFWMAKGAERIFYGLDQAAGAETVVIVEGEIDALSIDEAQGWPALSVPDGAPSADATNYTSKFAFLESGRDILSAARTVILATDMDAPGQKLADELARRIGPEKCQRAIWPLGCKDANDTLIAYGANGVAHALADAQPYPVAGIATVRDLAGPLDALYEGGLDRGPDTGWVWCDAHYRARAGLMTIATGQPGSGKTALIDNLMVRLAERHGWSFGIYSPENQPVERHLASLLTIRVGKPFADGPTPRMTREDVHSARRWAEGRFMFILPEEPTLDAILERAKILVYRSGIRGLVLDPWNEIDHSRPDRLSETEYISQCLTRLRAFARLHGVHVWLVAHPTKLQKDKDGVYPVPTPYDVSGSAHFFNKSDACIAVWRDKTLPGALTQLHIQKIRFAETGKLGVVEFAYDRVTGRMQDVGAA
jgi:twinkle protein